MAATRGSAASVGVTEESRRALRRADGRTFSSSFRTRAHAPFIGRTTRNVPLRISEPYGFRSRSTSVRTQYVEAGGLDQLPFTPSRGDNRRSWWSSPATSRSLGRSSARAAAAKTLENKQVALVTCGGAFPETAELRERLLQSGSLMVWTPDRQVSPEAAARLKGYVRTRAIARTRAPDNRRCYLPGPPALAKGGPVRPGPARLPPQFHMGRQSVM